MTDRPNPVHLAAGDLEDELTKTRELLACIPDTQLDWQPHERSWPLGRLAGHLANLPHWQTVAMGASGFDLASAPPPEEQSPPGSTAEVLATFDRNAEAARAALADLTEEDLDAPWTLSSGETEVFTLPRSTVLRSMGISHLVHHRAQLGVYLRLLDVPLPWSYGPTADRPGPNA